MNQDKQLTSTADSIAQTAHTTMDRVRSRAAAVADSADAAVDSASSTVGAGLVGSAERVRSGAEVVAGGLENAGDYLKQGSGRSFMSDVTELMRTHPKATAGVGLALGFLLARRLRR